jgi:hypothetical protein
MTTCHRNQVVWELFLWARDFFLRRELASLPPSAHLALLLHHDQRNFSLIRLTTQGLPFGTYAQSLASSCVQLAEAALARSQV